MVILNHLGRADWIPMLDTDLVDWWADREVQGLLPADTCSSVLLIIWCLWRQGNDIVFNRDAPSASMVLKRE